MVRRIAALRQTSEVYAVRINPSEEHRFAQAGGNNSGHANERGATRGHGAIGIYATGDKLFSRMLWYGYATCDLHTLSCGVSEFMGIMANISFLVLDITRA